MTVHLPERAWVGENDVFLIVSEGVALRLPAVVYPPDSDPNVAAQTHRVRCRLDEEEPMPIPGSLSFSLTSVGTLTNIISVCSYMCTVGVMSSTIIFLTFSGLSSASRWATLAPRSCATMWNESYPKCFLLYQRRLSSGRSRSAHMTCTISSAISFFEYSTCECDPFGLEDLPYPEVSGQHWG